MTRRDAHPHNLTLAVGIAEWATVLDHIGVLTRMGQGPSEQTLTEIQREFTYFCVLWRTGVNEFFTPEQIPTIVAEARAFATLHQSEIDELTNRTGVST